MNNFQIAVVNVLMDSGLWLTLFMGFMASPFLGFLASPFESLCGCAVSRFLWLTHF